MNEGTLVVVEGRPTLRFERRYRQPVERVWRAVTDPDELSRWFPSKVVGDRVVGAELELDGYAGKVVAFDPPAVFAFTWGDELLRFELHADGAGTRLLFTQQLSHQSVAARNGAGWHACLAELDGLLDGAPPGDDDGWEAMYTDYLLRIGPELGVGGAGGSMTWERATHVEPAAVEATSEDLAAWGAGDHAGAPLRWSIEPLGVGTRYRVTHDAIGDDAALAATWHALLLQLDLYLAAGVLHPVDPTPWIERYS